MANILLGVSASVAAYKALEFARLATKAGHRVRVVQTPSSLSFVGRASFEAVTGAPVLVDEFEGDPAAGRYPGEPAPTEKPITHLEVASRADIYLIAPASANTIAKLSAGMADSMLTAAYLACSAPVVIVPAMNNRMWQNKATQENLQRLRSRGLHVIEPGTGPLASKGEWGIGRLPEATELLNIVESIAASGVPRGMDGMNVLVTAGGTREAIDSVRFLGNRSSGMMGFALAEECLKRGANVSVIAANISLARNPAINYRDVESAEQMRHAVAELYGGCDLVIMAAAVADFKPKSAATGKIDKSEDLRQIELERTADIASELGAMRRPGQLLIGFAAEYGPNIGRAREKMAAKGLDAIVLNDISLEEIGFESDLNEVTIVFKEDERKIERAPKPEIAQAIVDEIEKLREYTEVDGPTEAKKRAKKR